MVYWAKDRGHLGKRPWSLGRKTVVSWRSSADNAVPASRAHRDFKPLFACFVLDYCLNDDLRNSHAQNGTRAPCVRHDTAQTNPLETKGTAPSPAFHLRFSG